MAEGRKQKAGGVPEGWQSRALGELLTGIQGGFSVNASDSPANEGQAGILKLSSVLDGVFKPEQNKAVTEEDLEHLSVFPKAESVIISRANTKELVGMCGYVPHNFPTLFLPDLLWQLQGNPEQVNMRWLSYWLSSPQGRDKVTALAAGSNASMVKINKETFKKLPILLPPLPEQRKIAAILSTWEDSLATLTNLLAAKRQQKRGLAEALLTGKTRLKGFAGEWEEKRLGEAALVTMGTSPSSSAYNDGGVGLPLIQGNADIKNRIAKPRVFTSEITRECESDDIILSVRAPVGSVSRTPVKACIGRGVAAIRSKTNQDFLYFLLELQEGSWGSFMQGSTFESVTSKEVKAFPLSLPPLPEQKAIASILSTLDAEIASLEALKAKVQEQKRGLMDELLTGRVRVEVNVEDSV